MIQFTHLKYTVQFFLVYSYNLHTHQPQDFHQPKEKTLYPLSVFFLPQNTILLSISIDLPILDSSCKWNKIMCGLLCLVPVTEHDVFKVYSQYV